MDNKKILAMDPYILLSWINTKLRDEFNTLDMLCDDYEIENEDIINKLKFIDYIYNEETNQFISSEA
ncbi:DUF4250 domain-containing protein [Clostridium sp. DJ247]|uniref:DUF4250 domain-containing protein n=1 Tax=Clostridium sp. DJ247 TaxID=2726188 RepID=UPI00162A8BA0|nr:DUF4250 domain-containing protein [Clostridium sp. DJ247]